MLEKFELSSRQWARFKEILPVNNGAAHARQANRLYYGDVPLVGSPFNCKVEMHLDRHQAFFTGMVINILSKFFKRWRRSPHKEYFIIDTTLIKTHLKTVNDQDMLSNEAKNES